LFGKKAALGLPAYIMVALVVSAAVIAVFSLSIYNIWLDSQFHQVGYELNKIVSEAEDMFEYADEGTMVTVHVEFPGSMRYIIFGGLPCDSGSIPVSFNLDENTSNNYCFVMDDGRISILHSNARFSGNKTDEIAVFYPGVYDLKLELVKGLNGKSYVKIY